MKQSWPATKATFLSCDKDITGSAQQEWWQSNRPLTGIISFRGLTNVTVKADRGHCYLPFLHRKFRPHLFNGKKTAYRCIEFKKCRTSCCRIYRLAVTVSCVNTYPVRQKPVFLPLQISMFYGAGNPALAIHGHHLSAFALYLLSPRIETGLIAASDRKGISVP